MLFHSPLIGFDALEPAFLAELEARSLLRGGQFLDLPFAKRIAVCVEGLNPSNPSIVVWEAAIAVAFASFMAAATQPQRHHRHRLGIPGDGLSGHGAQRLRGTIPTGASCPAR